jgi:hypothetical protein
MSDKPSELELALETIANSMPLAILSKGVLDFTRFRDHVPYSFVINYEPHGSNEAIITIRTRQRHEKAQTEENPDRPADHVRSV